MPVQVSLIDLFAGPGGLGEGFASLQLKTGEYPFHIEMSVEMEESAHKTLELRSFFRQFAGNAPEQYYQYLRGELSRDELFSSFPEQSAAAARETLEGPATLGDPTDDRRIYSRLKVLRRKDRPWVVIGGPPCQAYSLVGRARRKGIIGYRPEADERHFLYQEYLEVLWTIQPEAFVMENVKGMLSANINGNPLFSRILEDLADPGRALGKRTGMRYRLYGLGKRTTKTSGLNGSHFVVRSEDFGIPQARHRVILLGVREDLPAEPEPLPSNSIVPAGMVLRDLSPLRSGLSRQQDSPSAWHSAIKRSASRIRAELLKLGASSNRIDEIVDQSCRLNSRGGRYVPRRRVFRGGSVLERWFMDPKLHGFINHHTRGHIEGDLARYLYSACYAELYGGESPRAQVFPRSLSPKHSSWTSGNFADRFKVQPRDKPSSTVTSHIAKDGHYYIHYDPAQCRSLTVREAARLQTFPDNYFFEGNRTQQYVQVGNAVPPLLARQIANIVLRILFGTSNAHRHRKY